MTSSSDESLESTIRATVRAGGTVLGRNGLGGLGFLACGGGGRVGTVLSRERRGFRRILPAPVGQRSCRLARAQ